jgi:hypothetical protein
MQKLQAISDWVDIMILRAPPLTGDHFEDHLTLVEESIARTAVQITGDRREVEVVTIGIAAELLRRILDDAELP